MIAAWALYMLIRLAPLSWLTVIGLAIWRLAGAPDNIDLLCIVVSAMAVAGSGCYAMRRYRPDTAGLVLQAVLATQPQPTDDGRLRLVTQDIPSAADGQPG